MKNHYFFLISICVFVGCTLDESIEIPTGVTNEVSPVFIKSEVQRIALDGVSAQALLITRGNLNILDHGWVWSESPEPTLQDKKIEMGALGNSSYDTTISGFALGKTYHIRPFVSTGSKEIIFGPEKTLFFYPTFNRPIGENGDEVGYSVQQTMDGGFILGGNIVDYGDSYMVKTNASGIEEWKKIFPGDGYHNPCTQTADGGFVLLNTTYNLGAGGYDLNLIKTDTMGNEQWKKNIGGPLEEYGVSLQQTMDGGFIIGGQRKYDDSKSSIYLVKTDALGVPQWESTFGGNFKTRWGYVQQTKDGGYILVGTIYEINNVYYDIYIVKADGMGVLQWEKKIGIEDNPESGYYIQQTADGGFILSGYRFSSSLGFYMYLVKIDVNGVKEWDKNVGELGQEATGFSVKQTKDGGYILGGYIENNAHNNLYLVKTNSSGDVQWERMYPGVSFTGGGLNVSLLQLSDGGYIMLGTVESGGHTDMVLIKTDENGNAY